MKITSIIYYIIAVILLVYFASLALPFLKNLLPGMKLIYSLFPVMFILMTHFTPREIIKAFRLAGSKSQGSKTEYQNAFLFFKTAQQLFVVIMLLGIMILVIWSLASGPSNRQIAHPMAIIFGVFIYPLLFMLFICLPYRSALQKKLNDFNT